uniref:ADAMTS cysteine-rich domain-containing protein n=1 Tax=Glossina brevipalpis TaxID=37001 RepID=A0A1A9W6T3_9MUSC
MNANKFLLFLFFLFRNSSNGKRYLSNDCVGIYRRYQLCNEQACPYSNEEFRALQCSYYNDMDFQGRKYIWEPYIKDDAECELNCKPLGMRYFATLNATVIDGTVCYHPAEYYRYNYQDGAMCVSGICKVRKLR